MNKTLRETKKEAERMRAARHFVRDEENRVILNMNVKDDTNFLSVFSETETPMIAAEVAEFIEDSASAVPPKEELTLCIHSNCIDGREKVCYEKAIREYYLQKYMANAREYKRNRRIALFLTLTGILVLGAEIIFEYINGNAVWAEVIDIVAWVLLWEAVDLFAFGNRALQLKNRRYLSFLSMKIRYIDG